MLLSILKFLFPEYQIFASIKRNGFIFRGEKQVKNTETQEPECKPETKEEIKAESRAEFRVKPEEETKTELNSEPKGNNSDFDLQNELNQVVSLDSVKQYVKGLESKIRSMNEREKSGFSVDRSAIMNLAFLGNPGTGKTMMAKIITETMYQLNAIPTNHYQEAEAADLLDVDSEVTAVNIWQMMENAQGGVLHINHAHLLMKSREDETGKAAVEALVKEIEARKGKIVLILSGNRREMNSFLNRVGVLQSFFSNILEFPNYSTGELVQIAENYYQQQGMTIDREKESELKEFLSTINRDDEFENARCVLNYCKNSLNHTGVAE